MNESQENDNWQHVLTLRIESNTIIKLKCVSTVVIKLCYILSVEKF